MFALSAAVLFQLATAVPQDTPRAAVEALVSRARQARFQQDSALASYQAIARQRMSASIGLSRGLVGSIGRPRLAARFESVARVGWHHTRGAWGEIIAARSVAPVVGNVLPQPEDQDVALVLPYYPGRERLWPVTEMRDALPQLDDWILHPLEAGADTAYAFMLGDSIRFRSGRSSVITLREIRVRPRRPDSRLVTGSLWVDVASGALVRAAYRPSIAMDLWPFFGDELDRDTREKVRKLGPFVGTVREVVVEHGLYDLRFWLPRTRIASAEGTAKMGRVTVTVAQTFTYERVEAVSAGSSYAFSPPPPDVDSRDGRERRPRWRGLEGPARRCRATGDTVSAIHPDSLGDLQVMYSEGVRFRVLVPCDRTTLVTSAALPGSVYDSGEEMFAGTDLQALRTDVEDALSLGSQAQWEPQPVRLEYGIDGGMVRYNRVEGLSAGVRAERVLGAGYTGSMEVRVGTADLEPNGEVSVERSNVRASIRGTAYRRLAAANDWGDVLGLGASLRAAVFGQDDGFYYRALGAEVTGTLQRAAHGPVLTWRVFAEHQDSARVRTHESIARLLSDTRFPPNVQATPGPGFGAAAGLGFSWGLDPAGTRLTAALRTEAGTGEASYGRALIDATLTRGLGARAIASLTTAAGASVGALPPQRLFFIGGAYTVRGHRAGSAAGDAFWLGRAEVAKGHPLVRPALFADIGWAGARDTWATPGRPLSGAGAGATFLDGMVRLDIARGLGANGRWRADFYFEPR